VTDHQNGPLKAPSSGVPAKVPTNPGRLWQFGGWAGASVICGLLSIVVPIDTTFTFPLFTIAGLIMGVHSIWQGRVAGGTVGVALSLLGGLVSLFASFGGGYI
jgi:hypothetical protein